MRLSLKDISILMTCFFFYQFVWLKYDIIVPFTNNPADYALLLGLVFAFLILFVRPHLLKNCFARPYSRILLPLFIFLSINIPYSIMQQGWKLTILTHRYWLYIGFLIVGYLLITPRYRFKKLIDLLQIFAGISAVGALFYSLSTSPGEILRFYPDFIPLSGIFIAFNLILYIYTRSKLSLNLLALHVTVSILTLTRSWWACLAVMILVLVFTLRLSKLSYRFVAALAFVGLWFAFFAATDTGFTAQIRAFERYQLALQDIRAGRGTYQHRIDMFLDSYDYLLARQSDLFTKLFGIGMLHSDSQVHGSLIGRGRTLGYSGRGVLLENAYANYLLGAGFIGTLLIFWTYIALSRYMIDEGKPIRQQFDRNRSFMLSIGAFHIGWLIALFFGGQIQGTTLGLMLFIAGAWHKEKTLENAGKSKF